MNKINLGIIGEGYHYKKNIKPILSNLKKVINLKIFILKKKNKDYNYINFFDKKIDICYLATPSKTHFNLAKICINNGVSVISEKPLCETFLQAQKLISLAKSRNVFISEAFMYLYHPIFKYLKKLVSIKKLEILYVKSQLSIPSLNKKNNRYNFKKGGGFYNDLAIYPLSLEYHLFNSKKLLKINKLIYSKKKIPLRGYMNFKSNSFERFYFWGEGQKYQNNLSIIFKNLSIHVDNFYSKNPNKLSYIEINGKKDKKLFFPKCNQFYEMFLELLSNFKKKEFVSKHYKNIMNLSKIKKQL
jgi:predicted dehydrogenase